METFSASLALVRGIHRWPVDSTHKGQWRGTFMFPLICTRPEPTVEQIIETLLIWDAIHSLWHHCNKQLNGSPTASSDAVDRLNTNTPSYQYPHDKDKDMAVLSLSRESPCPEKRSIYWNRAQLNVGMRRTCQVCQVSKTNKDDALLHYLEDLPGACGII